LARVPVKKKFLEKPNLTNQQTKNYHTENKTGKRKALRHFSEANSTIAFDSGTPGSQHQMCICKDVFFKKL
jgi:hypothetical protein